MKLGPVTKFDNRNKTTSKRVEDDVILKKLRSFSFFQFYGQSEVLWNLESIHTVCEAYVFTSSNLLSYKI